MHYEWTMKALTKGKHVLCEKPLAPTKKQAEEMFATAEKNHVFLMEAFAYQHSPYLKEIEKEIVNGQPIISCPFYNGKRQNSSHQIEKNENHFYIICIFFIVFPNNIAAIRIDNTSATGCAHTSPVIPTTACKINNAGMKMIP